MSDTAPQSKHPNRDLQRGAAVAAAVLLVSTALYLGPVADLLGAGNIPVLLELIRIVAILISVGLALILWRHFSPGETLQKIYAYIALGLLLSACGEIIWAVAQLTPAEKLADPSLADAAWLASYAPILAGLILRYRSFKITPRRTWQYAVLSAFGVITLLAAAFVIVPILLDTTTSSLLAKLVDLAYPIGDLLVGFWALLMVLVLAGGILSTPWLFVALGCLAAVSSDLLYAFATSNAFYRLDPVLGSGLTSYIINILFLVSYGLIGLGLFHQARLQNAL